MAELVGTAFLLIAVVGSGMMGERLAGGNVGLALLANSLATGAALVALILAFGPVSGGHFNPVVSLVDLSFGGVNAPIAVSYVAAQLVGATAGVGIANYIFEQPIFFLSHHAREGMPQLVSEALATFGLISVIWGTSRHRSAAVPFAVGAYITAAYWFTASTSFANPAVTLARACDRHVCRHSAGRRAGFLPGRRSERPQRRCYSVGCSDVA